MAELPVKRDWRQARAKVEAEGHCRVCKRRRRIEAAHVIGRAADEPNEAGVLYVNPASIVPLCGPPTDSHTCHGRYDSHELDLLPYLRIEEQVQAVHDAGGLELAHQRTAPSLYRRKIARAA